jgi:hypothetical protein
MKKNTLEDCVNYYIILRVAGEEIPIWLTGQLLLVHFLSHSYIDMLIQK